MVAASSTTTQTQQPLYTPTGDLTVVGRSARVPRSLLDTQSRDQFHLAPLVQMQQAELSAMYSLVGSLKREVALLTSTLRESQQQSHERETELIRVLHRMVVANQ